MVLSEAVNKDGEFKDGVVVPLMRIVGKCDRYQVKTTDLGESVALKGNFQATCLRTGETVRAATCYLPETASDMVAGMLAGDDVGAVEFGFDISVVSDGDAIVNYVYEIKPLIEPQEDDGLARLAASLPALPGAKPEASKKGSKKAS